MTLPAPYYRDEKNGIVLYHGDCLDLLSEIEAGSVDAVVTDPPYGARRPSARRSVEDQFNEIAGNDVIDVRWAGFPVLKTGGACYCFCTWDTMHAFGVGLKEASLRVRSLIVWGKMIHGLADLATCWAPRHEMILFAANGRHELRSPRPVDVIQCRRLLPEQLDHPYQKPVPLIVNLIEASTDKGSLVADWYAGSGTTLVACIRSGRHGIGFEISEPYCEIAARRLEREAQRFPLFEEPKSVQRELVMT